MHANNIRPTISVSDGIVPAFLPYIILIITNHRMITAICKIIHIFRIQKYAIDLIVHIIYMLIDFRIDRIYILDLFDHFPFFADSLIILP